MTQTVIYNKRTKYVYATYPTDQGARTAFTRACTRLNTGKTAKLAGKRVNVRDLSELAVTSAERFRNEINQLTTVRSLMTGAEVTIRESEVGGPCDPSTERYWSM